MSIHVTHLVNGPIGGPASASQRWHREFEHLADAMKATSVGFHERVTRRPTELPTILQGRSGGTSGAAIIGPARSSAITTVTFQRPVPSGLSARP